MRNDTVISFTIIVIPLRGPKRNRKSPLYRNKPRRTYKYGKKEITKTSETTDPRNLYYSKSDALSTLD